MAVFRSVFLQPLLIILISLSVSLGLLFLGSLMGYEEFKGGYAVLSTDVSVDDRMLVSLLNNEHGFLDIFAGKPVSESTQWVVLDNFESLETVALDKYFSRVFPFDPRYDGYAEKLRDIFIKDGKRYVYIPLAAGNWNSASIDKQIASLLNDIPYSVDYSGIGRPLLFFFIMYAAASLCFLIICLARNKAHYGYKIIIALVPVLSSLAFFGASGIGCAALFLAAFVVLKEPLGEIAVHQGQSQSNQVKTNTFKKFIKEKIVNFRFYYLLVFAIFASVAVIVVFSQIKPLFLLTVFFAALFVYILSLKISSIYSIQRRRFSPVMIIKKRFPDFSFSFYMLPFAAAAFLTLFLAVYQTSSYVTDTKFDIALDEQDYYQHLEYQTSFSTRQFGSQSKDFPSFFFDTDGLPAIKTPVNNSIETQQFPPFPLKHLMDFFYMVNSGEKTNSGNAHSVRSDNLSEKIVLLVLVFFALAGFFIKRKNDYSLRFDFSGFRRMAGESRGIGINWNKTLLYNDRNQKRSQPANLGRQTLLGSYRKDA
ncbi:MAG: hypothetical protein FWB86_00055 [Treponema sp.]|nr:hypothetical protein [Treponema sp.]MCL2251556.1 hypothetical protein [Treponema sp.]